MVLSGSVCCETDGVAIVDNLTAEMEASSNWQMTKYWLIMARATIWLCSVLSPQSDTSTHDYQFQLCFAYSTWIVNTRQTMYI